MVSGLPESDKPSFFGLPANIDRSKQRTVSSQVLNTCTYYIRIYMYITCTVQSAYVYNKYYMPHKLEFSIATKLKKVYEVYFNPKHKSVVCVCYESCAYESRTCRWEQTSTVDIILLKSLNFFDATRHVA